MYFDFEDYRPDISPVGRAISWREGVLISIIVHLMAVILVLLAPRLLPENRMAQRLQQLAARRERPEPTRFVFVQPRVDLKAPRAPERAEPSDIDREARTRERAKEQIGRAHV